ncbi:hypothetical protein ACWYVZ_00625 [Pediococcus acidilactici]
MPLFACFLDFLALGTYFIQLNHPSNAIYVVGAVIQLIITAGLLLIAIGYRGPRFTAWRPAGFSYLTIRYGIIIVSLVINGLILFLYGLNLSGTNPIVFNGF